MTSRARSPLLSVSSGSHYWFGRVLLTHLLRASTSTRSAHVPDARKRLSEEVVHKGTLQTIPRVVGTGVRDDGRECNVPRYGL